MKKGRKSTIPWRRLERLLNQGMSYTEISKQENIPVGTIQSHFYLKGRRARTKQHFTPKEDKIILDCIGKNQLNIRAAVEEAANILRTHSAGAILHRWYENLSLNKDNITYLTESFHLNVANRKVAKRGRELRILPQEPTRREKTHINTSFILYNFVSTSTVSGIEYND